MEVDLLHHALRNAFQPKPAKLTSQNNAQRTDQGTGGDRYRGLYLINVLIQIGNHDGDCR
ncbi:hypothetical protein PCI56_18490 [Plesiomonas shigelloides subsp. oncorhynchi]|nr:hypothetical protein [Plesiomonas shigelloides]